MKMSNNRTKYEIPIKQYSGSILDISDMFIEWLSKPLLLQGVLNLYLKYMLF